MKTIQSRSPDFFLGATTPAGFKGYFEPLRREPGMQMLLIKSGPGCGKSTLMKHLAQAAEQQGQRIEKIHCASDPDSLDGVIFLDQKRAIIDATAPHVVEPDAPGADEVVVSLYHTIDAEKLHQCTDEVKALFARNALLRSRAARYIASAGSLLLDADEHTAYLSGAEVPLTVREFDLLYKLLSYPKKTFTRAQLMEEFWEMETSSGPRTVDVYITKLRDKFSACDGFEIKTVRGLGYKVVLK